jgi:transcriptional regulator with XRE-family HTH domain
MRKMDMKEQNSGTLLASKVRVYREVLVSTSWKKLLGQRLREFREQSNKGHGLSHKDVAATARISEAYVKRMENHLERINPTLDKFEKLCRLYGRDIAELFEILPSAGQDYRETEIHEKLEHILKYGKAPAMETLIEAMYQATRRQKKSI